MAIEKPLYPAPLGETSLDSPLSDISNVVEIIELEDGGVEIILEEGTSNLANVPFGANLAEHMSDDELLKLSSDLIEEVDADIQSRSDWVDTYVKGLDIIGLKYEERTEPWPNACGVHSTLLAEAVIRFQAETMSETFPAAGPVKTKIIGEETKEKEEAANRVMTDMNYLLTEVMTEYRPEHERLLWSLGLSGSAFKKIYFDPSKNRQVALYVPAEEVIIPYGNSTIEGAERITHIMRKTVNEYEKLVDSEFYIDAELDEPESFHSDIEEKKAEDAGFTLSEDNRYAFYEIHCEIVVLPFDKETDLAKPYVVTIDKTTNKVLSIRRNWKEDDEQRLKRQHFVHYMYIPGFGAYGLGLMHIIGGYAMGGTSLIRQLVDAGTLSNLPGGLKSRDLRLKGNDDPIGPGEWKDVDVPSGAIKDHIMPLPYGEPSPTLLALLEIITTEGRRLGAISDMDVSDMSANAPVGTTLALLERTLKPMAAVQARVHYSMKQEFKLLKDIIAEHASIEYDYQPETGELSARQSDYQLVTVIPVSDPNSTTMAQRVVQYQAVLQMSTQSPEIYDMPELHRQMIDVLGVKNADKLIPLSKEQIPQDPVTENMGALVGNPMKAFIYQDQDAHIASHTSFIQDPMIAQTIGQNPQAQQIMASIQAHIAEHLGFAYRKKIEEKLGVELPPPGKELPEEIEVMLSRVSADAGKQLTQSNQKQDAQKKAQQEAQDPSLEVSREEAKTKRMEVERKANRDKEDLRLREEDQQRKRAKDTVDSELGREKAVEDRRKTNLAAQQAGETLTTERQALDDRTSIEALKVLNPPNKPNSGE